MGLLYQRRRLKVNKIKRQIAANRTMLKRLRLFLSLVLILSISYFCYWVLNLPQWYIDSEKLAKANNDTLRIYGNVITPDYKIINMVRQTRLPNVQIFRLDTTELENNISQLHAIKKVYVRRYWFPARLIINVDERTPAFLLAPNLESEPNSALTTDGVLIDKDYLPLNPSIKTKKLLTYGVKDGVDEIWDKKRTEELLKIIKAFETYSSLEVKYIDLRNSKDVYLMLDKHLIRLGLLNEKIMSRAKFISPILKQTKKYENKIKYIDLSWDDSYYFRLKEAKEEIKVQKPTEQEIKVEPNQIEAAQAAKIPQEESMPEAKKAEKKVDVEEKQPQEESNSI